MTLPSHAYLTDSEVEHHRGRHPGVSPALEARGAKRPARGAPTLMTTGTVFIITIDTEGDNLFGRRPSASPQRTHATCRDFRACATPTASSPPTSSTMRWRWTQHFRRSDGQSCGIDQAEIGLHVHPWYSPPLDGAYKARSPHIYLYDLPDDMLQAKVESLTRLLSDVFEARPVSHRAGKWGFDERVARVLADQGYLVDCSVTPGISWKNTRGCPAGRVAPTFPAFRRSPLPRPPQHQVRRRVAIARSSGHDQVHLSCGRAAAVRAGRPRSCGKGDSPTPWPTVHLAAPEWAEHARDAEGCGMGRAATIAGVGVHAAFF